MPGNLINYRQVNMAILEYQYHFCYNDHNKYHYKRDNISMAYIQKWSKTFFDIRISVKYLCC